MIAQIPIATSARRQIIDITAQVRKIVAESRIDSGICVVFTEHTTAAITINENADPDVKRDILHKLAQVFPQSDDYHHGEGNSDSHIQSSLVGCSETVIIEKGKLLLGTWQGICFCEFDGPRRRTVFVKIVAG